MVFIQRPGRIVLVHRIDEAGVAGNVVEQHLDLDVAGGLVGGWDQAAHLLDGLVFGLAKGDAPINEDRRFVGYRIQAGRLHPDV